MTEQNCNTIVIF